MNKRGLEWWIWLVIIIGIIAIIAIFLFFRAYEKSDQIPEPARIDCSSDQYNCDDFETCDDAKNVFDACKYVGDPHNLDRDSNGIPCESLCA